jgi:hypothetical protein
MENPDVQNLVAAGLAGVIFLGAMLMMFTNFWTNKGKR